MNRLRGSLAAALVVTWMIGAGAAAAQTTIAVDGQSTAAVMVPPNIAASVLVAGDPGGPLDWITLVKTTDGPNVYRAWCYLATGTTTPPTRGVTSALLSWALPPSDPSLWEFRVFRDNGYVRSATSPTVTVAPVPTVLVSVLVCSSYACVTPIAGALVELRDHTLPASLVQRVSGPEGLAGFYVSALMYPAPYVVVYEADQVLTSELACITGCLTTVSPVF